MSADRTDELTPGRPATRPPAPADGEHGEHGVHGEHYEVRVRGRLGARWAAWFDGFDLSDEADGTTVLRGPIVDQAALHGLLEKLRDLGIPLLSLARTPNPNHPPDHHPHEHHGATS